MKDIKAYLPFYLGCEVMFSTNNGIDFNKSDHKLDVWDLVTQQKYEGVTFKPILRPISDATKEEKNERVRLMNLTTDGFHAVKFVVDTPESFMYLLSRHFDIFNLHEAGLCLYKNENLVV